MRGRVTVAFVAVVVLTLLLAGSVSLFLIRNAENSASSRTVLRQARAIVSTVNHPARRGETPAPSNNTAVNSIISVFQKFGVNANAPEATRNASGSYSVSPPIPGVGLSEADARSLAAGQTLSGVQNGTAYAIVPLLPIQNGWIDFSLTTVASAAADNIWYFLLAGGISLLVAGLVAAVLSKRISRHVVAAAGAARRIAQGDLGTHVPVAQSYPELAALGSSINTMAAGLERARNLEREFLLSVSHDLRTPLTSIRGYAEAIADGLASDPRQAAGVVVAEASRLARLIGDLLDLAKIDAKQFSVHLAPTDAGAAVERAGEAHRYEFEASEIALEVQTPDEPVVVSADADRLVQLVGNLVDNALKFARAKVEIALVADRTEARITVADDGVGIDPDDLERIFERHFSSSRRAARAAGSGLGLAIVAELTAAMGGRIDVLSPISDGGGTAVSVSLPRPATEADRPAEPVSALPKG